MPSPFSHSVHVTGFGFAAGSGKDTVADYLALRYKGSRPLRTSFAKRLRSEVHAAMYKVMAQYHLSPREALKAMCEREGVKYDPFASRSPIDPHSKQRFLLQAVGMKRRAQDPDYWVKKVAEEIELKKPSLVLISDLRFENEMTWINEINGATVHVLRPDNRGLEGDAASHASECSLKGKDFDRTILNDGSLKDLHKKALAVYKDILQLRMF